MSFWTTERLRSEGRGILRPFDQTQVVNCSLELTLGAEGYVTGTDVDEKVTLQKKGARLIIPPGQFALLLTEETVSIPSDAIGLISVKFSFKLRGLVNVSGFHVDPGYNGPLIFSVYNAGGSDVIISRGERLFLMWLASLENKTEDTYRGTRGKDRAISNKDIMSVGPQHFSPAEVNDRLTSVEVRVATILNIAVAIFAAIVVGIGLLVLQQFVDDARSKEDLPQTNRVIRTVP